MLLVCIQANRLLIPICDIGKIINVIKRRKKQLIILITAPFKIFIFLANLQLKSMILLCKLNDTLYIILRTKFVSQLHLLYQQLFI